MRLINRIYYYVLNLNTCGVTSLFRIVTSKYYYSIIIILFAYATQTHAQVERHYLRQGNKKYNDKNYEEAQINYRKALNENGNSYTANFNLGDALYQQKDFNGAAQKFEVAASAAKNKTEKAKAMHNMGNAYLKADRLTQAIDAYKQALRNNPDDKETKYNLSYALKKQKEQEKQNKENEKNKQNQQNKQDKKDQKENQDKQDQDKSGKDKDKEKQDQNNPDKEKDKKDNQQQNEGQDEPKDEKDGNEKQQPQQGRISDAEAERILNAIKSEEQKVQQRIYQRNKDQQKNSKAKGKQW